jgi:hypothetical protein
MKGASYDWKGCGVNSIPKFGERSIAQEADEKAPTMSSRSRMRERDVFLFVFDKKQPAAAAFTSLLHFAQHISDPFSTARKPY